MKTGLRKPRAIFLAFLSIVFWSPDFLWAKDEERTVKGFDVRWVTLYTRYASNKPEFISSELVKLRDTANRKECEKELLIDFQGRLKDFEVANVKTRGGQPRMVVRKLTNWGSYFILEQYSCVRRLVDLSINTE